MRDIEKKIKIYFKFVIESISSYLFAFNLGLKRIRYYFVFFFFFKVYSGYHIIKVKSQKSTLKFKYLFIFLNKTLSNENLDIFQTRFGFF